jgi:hypothetical protein
MAIDDERVKEQEQVSSNVRPFIPRTAVPASKTEQGSDPLAIGRNMVDNDDDPGPSAA